MIRKLLMAAGAVTLFGLFFWGTDASSYVSTGAGKVKNAVKESVPIEFEIERARGMVADLVPDIRRNMHVIAEEEVEVAQLDEQITNLSTKLEKDKADIMRLTEELSTPRTVYVLAGREYEALAVKSDLSNRFARYKTNEATLGSLRDIHQARTQSLAAAREKLDGMLAARRQLEVEVENLDAKLKMVEVAQTSSRYSFDDSRLGRAKELISDLRTRLDVASRMLSVEGELQGEIPLDAPSDENVVAEVTEYFSAGGPSARLAEK